MKSSTTYNDKNSVSNKIPISPMEDNEIQPYIGLRAKLATAWLTYPIIALLFVAFRLLAAMRSIPPIVDDIKQVAIRSCNSLELATSTMTSFPHFMAGGFNRATVENVQFTIRAAAQTLDLAFVALKGVTIWMIHHFRRTYRCLLEFAIRGSIGAVADVVNTLSKFTSDKLNFIKTEIDDQVSTANAGLESARKAIGSAGSLLGSNAFKFPPISISATEDLANFKFPDNLGQDLQNLNNTMPTMNDIESKLDDLISIPFDKLQQVIKDTLSKIQFKESVLPVPGRNKVVFCAENLKLDIIDDIARDLTKAAYIGLAILFIIGILLIVANAASIWYSHRRFIIHVDRVTTTIRLVTVTFTRQSTIELIKIAEHPLISRWLIKTSKFFNNVQHQYLYRWFLDFILQKAALICLLIGVIGILGVYFQIAMIKIIRHNYRKPIEETFNAFGNSVLNRINSNMGSTSRGFSRDVNKAVSNVENEINQEFLGWVNITTTTLNSTLNSAVDEITKFVKNTFQQAPVFMNVANQLVNCLLLVKIRGIQTGLKFIKDNAHIELPRVNDNILMVDNSTMNEVVGEITDKLIGSKDAGSTGGEIGRLFDQYENGLRSELPLFWVLIAGWWILVLMGIIRVIWFIYQERKNNGDDHKLTKESNDFLVNPYNSTLAMKSIDEEKSSMIASHNPSQCNVLSNVKSMKPRIESFIKRKSNIKPQTSTRQTQEMPELFLKSREKPPLPPKPTKTLPTTNTELQRNSIDQHILTRAPPPLLPKPSRREQPQPWPSDFNRSSNNNNNPFYDPSDNLSDRY
ncbi:hypothetical protein G9A89_005995 [Geosiphon pyriformis]|nr:hypothetical protein G9A89_005995 [Geosiphon pyriformis]